VVRCRFVDRWRVDCKGGEQVSLFPIASFDIITQDEANDCLVKWGHKMGALHRGNQGALCHALLHCGELVAITTASTLIMPVVGGGCNWMTRENTIELSRLCASRSGLCRVALRMWREFVFPATGYEFAVSYQDADLHNGNTYRFDGWKKVGTSRSGTDRRSGRPGRNKNIWFYGVAR
jgi:hypothetical protein